MLPLRLGIFSAIFALALWGLFSLLDNLREPELLRSPKTVAVKGCDPIESDEAARLCPQLFCQKALLDARAFPMKTRFEVTVDRQSAGRRLIGGVARGDAPARFACLTENNAILAARAVSETELTQLAGQPGDWLLDAAAADLATSNPTPDPAAP